MTSEKKKLIKYVVIDDSLSVSVTVTTQGVDENITLFSVTPNKGLCPDYSAYYGRVYRSIYELRQDLLEAKTAPREYQLSDLTISPMALIREITECNVDNEDGDILTEDVMILVSENRLYLHNLEIGCVLRFMDGEWGSNKYSPEPLGPTRI